MRCRSCGAATRPTARFCDQCGSQLEDGRAGSSRPEAPASGLERGDRRIVTALFADLVDYVRLVAEHDPEDVRRWVDAALLAMVEAIESFGGTREKFIGDAVFAVFGWPRGHDDDALRAAHCALAIREAHANLDAPGAAPLQVRIGIATGEVVAAPRGDDGRADWSLTGPAVTTAARIQDVAAPGEILVEEATLRAARKDFDVVDLGEQVLRGQTRPVRIARLLGSAGFQPWHPPAGRLVGRTVDRARLRALLLSLVDGTGGAVVVEGEAGIGKSRLLAELEGDARSAGIATTWVDNVSYGSTEPYRFARALAQSVADEHRTDSGSMARRLLFTPDTREDDARQWAGAIAAMARDAAFSGWEAEASLVPAEPAAVAEAIRRTAIRYMERLIEVSGPRVVVVDDLHWLDPSSAGMLDELVGLTARLPLLIVFGTRPGPTPADASLAGVERLSLGGLDVEETRELAAAVLRGSVDERDARQLHDRTAGNPLFIAETVRAAIDERAREPAAGARPASAVTVPSLPITLRALLGARIDALPDEARTVIRVAAVVGVSFGESLVAELVDVSIDPGIYGQLAESSLIVPLDTPGRWRFGHPLIHDVAYGGLLTTTRRTLHARVADHLEAHAGQGAIGVVARHRLAAGDGQRAVPVLAQAAEEALAVGATSEAASFWDAAADLLGDDAAAGDYRRRAREALEAIPTAPSPG